MHLSTANCELKHRNGLQMKNSGMQSRIWISETSGQNTVEEEGILILTGFVASNTFHPHAYISYAVRDHRHGLSTLPIWI